LGKDRAIAARKKVEKKRLTLSGLTEISRVTRGKDYQFFPRNQKESDEMNVSINDKKTHLLIEIPMQAPTPSASGKTLVVATTRGNMKTSATVNGKPITIGLNAYIAR
jgi:hypothetical protein